MEPTGSSSKTNKQENFRCLTKGELSFPLLTLREQMEKKKFIFSVPSEPSIVVSTRCQANVPQISDRAPQDEKLTLSPVAFKKLSRLNYQLVNTADACCIEMRNVFLLFIYFRQKYFV